MSQPCHLFFTTVLFYTNFCTSGGEGSLGEMGVCRAGSSEKPSLPVPGFAYQLKQVLRLENPVTPGRGWLGSAGWCIWGGVTFVS